MRRVEQPPRRGVDIERKEVNEQRNNGGDAPLPIAKHNHQRSKNR